MDKEESKRKNKWKGDWVFYDVPRGKGIDAIMDYLAITDPSLTVTTAGDRIGVFNSRLSDETIRKIILYFKPPIRAYRGISAAKPKKINVLEYIIPPQYRDAIATNLSLRDPETEVSISPEGIMTIRSFLSRELVNDIVEHPENYQNIASLRIRKKPAGERMPVTLAAFLF